MIRRFVEHSLLLWVDITSYASADNALPALEKWGAAGRLMVQVVKQHAEYGGQKILEAWLINIVSKADDAANVERAKVLLNAGFDISKISGRASVMDVAVENGHRSMAQMLHHFGGKGTECCVCWISPPNAHLRDAAINEDGARALAALQARADPNRFDSWATGKRTPLMAFAASGQLAVCKDLVAFGAQVTQIDNFRCAAVHYAKATKEKEVEQFLVSIKEISNLGMKKGEQLAKYLQEAVLAGCCGAFAYAADEEGFQEACKIEIPPFQNSLLHIAVEATRENDPVGQVARVLINSFADPSLKNNRDTTPVHLAAQAGHQELYSIMCSCIDELDKTDNGHVRRRSLGGTPEDEKGCFGPRALLERNLKRKKQKEMERMRTERGLELNDDQKADNMLLLKTGFLGFHHNQLLAKLNLTREGDSASFLDILMQRMGESDGEESGSESADGSAGEQSVGSFTSKRSGKSSGRNQAKNAKNEKAKNPTPKGKRPVLQSKKSMSKVHPRSATSSKRSDLDLLTVRDDDAASDGSGGGRSVCSKATSRSDASKKWKKVQLSQRAVRQMKPHVEGD